MLSFNFICQECHSEHAQYVSSYSDSLEAQECPECSGAALKGVSAPKLYFEPISGDHIKATETFTRYHEAKGNGVRTL